MTRFRRWLTGGALLVAATGHALQAQAQLRYSVDLNDRSDSLFKVVLKVGRLPAGGIFQFAATAPGAYQVMDIGRYVRRLQAFDQSGRELPTSRINVNQWRLSQPARVREIRYTIAPTWTTPVATHPIVRMCGSDLAADHTLINGQAVFGVPRGMQTARVSVHLALPPGWHASTAMPIADGAYQADDYDHLVDSPILAGRLSTAEVQVTGVPVEIAVYSTHGRITANQLRDAMTGMLNAAGQFLGKLPVDHYTFLYTFEDRGEGAWEHSYSSEYALAEAPFTPALGRQVTAIAAHEFLHVVTPLNLHSDVIEHFDFESPVPSRHLWLYEGATEWAAGKMQLEAGLRTAADYLADVVRKFKADRQRYDTTWSLAEMSMAAYSDSGQRQFQNIYDRGAIVAGLLDIRLLELSGGQHGLRDLIQDLAARYGKHRSFPDDSLFAIIVARTDPSIGSFIDRYIRGTIHPPVAEYYAKLGFTLVSDGRGVPVRFDVNRHPTPAQLRLRTAWLGRRGNLVN